MPVLSLWKKRSKSSLFRKPKCFSRQRTNNLIIEFVPFIPGSRRFFFGFRREFRFGKWKRPKTFRFSVLVRVSRFELEASWTPFKRDTKLGTSSTHKMFWKAPISSSFYNIIIPNYRLDCKENYRFFLAFFYAVDQSVDLKSCKKLLQHKDFLHLCAFSVDLITYGVHLVCAWVHRWYKRYTKSYVFVPISAACLVEREQKRHLWNLGLCTSQTFVYNAVLIVRKSSVFSGLRTSKPHFFLGIVRIYKQFPMCYYMVTR